MATKILTTHFSLSGTPIVGLTPTIDIYALDQIVPTNNPRVVTGGTTSEIGGGWYRYQFTDYDPMQSYVFTFDGGNTLPSSERYKIGGNESYAEEIVPAVWDEPAINHVQSGSTGLILQQVKADTASIVVSEATIVTLLNLSLKYQRNRTRINLGNATLTIYDDDGVTPLTVFNLLDFNGMPNVQEVCEKIPVI